MDKKNTCYYLRWGHKTTLPTIVLPFRSQESYTNRYINTYPRPIGDPTLFVRDADFHTFIRYVDPTFNL